MAIIVDPVITNVGAERMLRQYGGLLSLSPPTYFRLGEGGWLLDPLTGLRTRRVPDPTFTDIDLLMDSGRVTKRYLGTGDNGMSYFQKAITSIVYEAPRTLVITCTVLAGEYNSKSDGTLVYPGIAPYTAPECWEIGVYDAADNLLIYGTMGKQTKTVARALTNVIRLSIP